LNNLRTYWGYFLLEFENLIDSWSFYSFVFGIYSSYLISWIALSCWDADWDIKWGDIGIPNSLSISLRRSLSCMSRLQRSKYSKWQPVDGSWYFRLGSSLKYIPLKLLKSRSSTSESPCCCSSSSYSPSSLLPSAI
jgi:hypothetical protein